MLRKMLGPKWEEVTGGWRKLNNDGLHYFLSTPHQYYVIKSIICDGWGTLQLWGEAKCFQGFVVET